MRARSDEQKTQRRQLLLDVTTGLLSRKPYNEINMSNIAKAVGLAKGTVYLYFSSKEELFLTIFEEQFQGWFDEINAELKMIPKKSNIKIVVDIFCKSLLKRPMMIQLLSILHTVLEQNIQYDVALQFKRMLLENVLQTGELIESSLLFIKAGEGIMLCFRVYAIILGIQQLTNPTPIVKEVIANEADMKVFDLDFISELETTITILLKGMENSECRHESGLS
jgi:AcrR family transcriptional regulator